MWSSACASSCRRPCRTFPSRSTWRSRTRAPSTPSAGGTARSTSTIRPRARYPQSRSRICSSICPARWRSAVSSPRRTSMTSSWPRHSIGRSARSAPRTRPTSSRRTAGEKDAPMSDYRGVDYYGIEALLSEEQRMVRDAVREGVEKEFVPVVSQHHRDGTFPIEVAKPLGEMGVFGATLTGYGCAGLDHVAYGLIMQELERGDSGLRSFASVQSGLVMYPIYAYGSAPPKEKWLPRRQHG